LITYYRISRSDYTTLPENNHASKKYGFADIIKKAVLCGDGCGGGCGCCSEPKVVFGDPKENEDNEERD